MQLLRVASTMSYQGSPYSGPGDEYDFEDDGYDDLDEYREQEDAIPQPPLDDSDEDTEEASETDIPNNDEPLEHKEQMYQDKLANLKKQLQQLEDGVHPEYTRRVKRLEHQLHERLRLNKIYKPQGHFYKSESTSFHKRRPLLRRKPKETQQDHVYDVIEREYIAEKKAAAKEFEEKKIELRENLLNDFEDKRKMIENERHSMELNGDSTEVKPVMKRILRRRANEPAPAPEKRRKPTTTLTFQLDERDIDADLRAIARHSPPPAPPRHSQPRKHHNSTSYDSTLSGRSLHEVQLDERDIDADLRAIARHSPPPAPPRHSQPRKHHNSTSCESPVRENNDTHDTRVEDGKLLFERRWFHRGQSVYVEGRDMPRFPGHIHAITDEAIWVKKTTNLERIRIYVSQLARGKVTIKRRAS